MTQLPLITSRSATRSVNHRSYPQQSKQSTYTERFQLVSKVTNYQGIPEQLIWKQYERLRQYLKLLNQSVLQEIEKRHVTLRKQSPRKKTVNQEINVIEEQCKTMQQAIKLSSIELSSMESRLAYVSGLNIRDLQNQHIKIKQQLTNLKNTIKLMKTKTFLLSKTLVKGTSILQKLTQSTFQLHFLQRKVFKYKNKLMQSEQLIQSCSSKLQQLTKITSSRQSQYNLFEKQTKAQNNLHIYQSLCNTKKQMNKLQSPFKKIYLLKLKELEYLVGTIEEEDSSIRQIQLSILKIQKEIDLTDSKTMVLRKKLKRQQGRFNSSMLEMRSSDQKETSDKSLQDNCF